MSSVDGSKSLLTTSEEDFHFKCDPCEYGGDTKEAKFFCSLCNEYLCEACKLSHQKLAATRKHHVVSGESMPEQRACHKQAQNENDIPCACNYGKVVTKYCKVDNEIMCVDCSILKHRNCPLLSVEEAFSEIVSSTREQTLKHAQELKDKVTMLKQERNNDMGSLAIQIENCRTAVVCFRKEINEHLDKLEEKAIADIIAYEVDKKGKIKQHIDACNSALTKLEAGRQSFESTLTSEKQAVFVQYLKLTKTIDDVNEALKDICKEVTPNISFACDRSLKCTNATGLGTVRTTEMMASQPIIVDMTVKTFTEVDVKDMFDRNEPWISGSVFMPSGEMVLCDLKNKVVKVLDPEFRLKEQINSQSRPWGISMMSDDEVVVSLPDKKSLSFLKVFPKLQRVSSIQLNQVCRGIAVCDGSIYVSFDNREVQIWDRNGQQMKDIYSALLCNSPYYISVPKPGMLLVSEHTQSGSIYLLEDGKEQYKYTHPELECPTGMYIDDSQNVYVCAFNSHNVHVIDKNGKHVKILLSANDGLKYPYTISFRESDSTLVVGGMSKLLVFKLG